MRAHSSWRSVVLTVLALSAASLAAAQAPSGSSAPAAAPSGSAAAPSASSSAAPAPTHPATGYGWSDGKPKGKGGAPRPVGRAVHPHPSGPIATMPGFEMQADGSSRLFVSLTQTVPVEEHSARGVLTYVLKGAHVALRNNTNPLVTVHFNTPVVRARLVPVGNDLHFIIELRAAVTPTWKITPGKDGTSLLIVDFPKGSYLPAGGPPDAAVPAPKR